MYYLKKISQFLNAISRITGVVSAIIMGVIALIVTYEVIMRYVFRNPTGWTLDFVPYLILWGAFLGGAITLRENRHIKVDLLIRHLSPRKQKILEIFSGGIAIVFCIVLCVKGMEMVTQTKQLGSVDASSLNIPLFIPQLCIPIGAVLLVLEFLKRLVNDVVSLKDGKLDDEGSVIS